ncbi:MAG: hypothetical protein O7F71_17835, partial [Gammaproteobacteria bacterium]|nr:hypothetical protein [Gammaproteobacteria bacterium]
GKHWRLYVSPGSDISAVTAILQPRQRYAQRSYPKPGFDFSWLLRYSDRDHNWRSNDRQPSQQPSLHTSNVQERGPQGDTPASVGDTSSASAPPVTSTRT